MVAIDITMPTGFLLATAKMCTPISKVGYSKRRQIKLHKAYNKKFILVWVF